jgi:hypothetical protein
MFKLHNSAPLFFGAQLLRPNRGFIAVGDRFQMRAKSPPASAARPAMNRTATDLHYFSSRWLGAICVSVAALESPLESTLTQNPPGGSPFSTSDFGTPGACPTVLE